VSTTAPRHEDLTVPEKAALDAWNRVSADTTGMLYAVRHALAAQRVEARARLARHLYGAYLTGYLAGNGAAVLPAWDDLPEREGAEWRSEADTILIQAADATIEEKP